MISKLLLPYIDRIFNQDEYFTQAIQFEKEAGKKYYVDTRPFLKFEDSELINNENEKTTSETVSK